MNLNKLTKEYKKVVGRTKELEAQLADFEAKKAMDIQQAVESFTVPLKRQIAELEEQVSQRDAEIAAWHGRALTAGRNLADREADLARLIKKRNDDVDELVAELEAEKVSAQAARDALAPAEAKIAELGKLLKALEDKISAKDKERVRAALNRQALAGAVPGAQLPLTRRRRACCMLAACTPSA